MVMAIRMVCEIMHMLRCYARMIRVPRRNGHGIVGAVFLFALYSAGAPAVSFTADVVQVKGGDLVNARLFWLDGRARFEYLDQGVQMAQIFDSKKNRVIWLDTEKKVYIQRDTAETPPMQRQLTVKSAGQKPLNPCDAFKQAQCVRLKNAMINHRDTDKWLITFEVDGRDEHLFQWIDKQYRIPLREENPDGSILDVSVIDDIEVEGRKAYKLEMLSIAPDGNRTTRIQWYDSELNVVIRQQDDDGTVKELRNIKLEAVNEDKFAIPEGYEALDSRLSASDNGSSLIFVSQ
jgi:hypothetical protein